MTAPIFFDVVIAVAVTIGSNISSLRTIRQLDATTRNLASTSERLASGQRINRASDDAAGLAIASSLDATSRVFTKALANVNDGISLLSITDGAMRELGTILTRVKELATQSANGSYSSVQRRALDEEGQKLRDEYNRILATTSFNGVKTLNGSQASVGIQAGSDGVSAPLQLTAPSLGEGATSESVYSLSFANATNDYVSLGAMQAMTSYTISSWIKINTAGLNVFFVTADSAAGNGIDFRLEGGGFLKLYSGGAGPGSYVETTSTYDSSDGWMHVAASRDSNGTGTIYVNGTAVASNSITAPNPACFGTPLIGEYHAAGGFGFDGQIDDVRIYNRALDSSELATLATGGNVSSTGLVGHYDFEEGSGTTAADSSPTGNNGTLANGATWSNDTPAALVERSAGLETFSLLTAADARSAMDMIESAFSRLSSEVGKVGSQLSRLQTVINTISATRENYQAAAGRIKDADVAQESANLVRHEILQQTASGVLAQANQQPRIAIQLLGAI